MIGGLLPKRVCILGVSCMCIVLYLLFAAVDTTIGTGLTLFSWEGDSLIHSFSIPHFLLLLILLTTFLYVLRIALLTFKSRRPAMRRSLIAVKGFSLAASLFVIRGLTFTSSGLAELDVLLLGLGGLSFMGLLILTLVDNDESRREERILHTEEMATGGRGKSVNGIKDL